MSQSNYSTIPKAGQIMIKETPKGIEFHAFNFQHGKALHIGTLIGRTYEKTAPILEKPEPSFSLPQSELGAAIEQGAEFVRFIGRGRPGTFSISVTDFQKYGQAYFNQSYGPQIRVSLTCPKLQHSPRVSERNNITDNPPLQVARDIVQEKQLHLFSSGHVSPYQTLPDRKAGRVRRGRGNSMNHPSIPGPNYDGVSCADCHQVVKKHFWLKTEVWASIAKFREILCLGCAEKRLDRKLVEADYDPLHREIENYLASQQ